METKIQTKDQAHLSLQDQLEDETKLSLLPDHQITDGTRAKKRKNQGSRRKNQSNNRSQGNRRRPTAQAGRAQRPQPRQQASPVRQLQKQQRPA